MISLRRFGTYLGKRDGKETLTMKKAKSSYLFAAAVLAVMSVSTSAFAVETAIKVPKGRVMKAAATPVVKPKVRRAKLPREWVWKRVAKNFDDMYAKPRSK
ncbi:MAG: hypothetical protein AAFN74_12035 [Myxococcota bacterium]